MTTAYRTDVTLTHVHDDRRADKLTAYERNRQAGLAAYKTGSKDQVSAKPPPEEDEERRDDETTDKVESAYQRNRKAGLEAHKQGSPDRIAPK